MGTWGGLLNLWIGINIVTFIEICDLLLKFCLKCVRGSRKGNQIEDSEGRSYAYANDGGDDKTKRSNSDDSMETCATTSTEITMMTETPDACNETEKDTHYVQ